MMKLLCWNMAVGCPQIPKSGQPQAWEYVLDSKPDIALLQEATVPTAEKERYHVAFAKAYRMGWGSAVLSRWPIEPFDLASLEPRLGTLVESLKGQVIAASVETEFGRLVAASIHTPAVAVSTDRIDSDLLPAIKLKLNKKVWWADVLYGALRHLPAVADRFIVGGDWNTSRLFDGVFGPRGNQEFFDRMGPAGLVECFPIFHPAEVQTCFKKGQAPYQLDHIFCDPETAKLLVSCRIDATPALNRLSDHAPLLVEVGSDIQPESGEVA